MIIREIKNYPDAVVYFMSDATILAVSVKATLLEVAKQAEALGLGLQNVAPGGKAGSPNNSVSYLLGISENLNSIAEECGKVQALSRPSPSP